MSERAIAIHGLGHSTARPVRLALGRPHWWQWPTILSLDAPVVTVLWQWLLARAGQTPLAWPQPVVLGASVWLAYAADRWIEGWRLAPADIKTQRHHFAQRWRWPMLACWLTILVADVSVAFARLTRVELACGAGLLTTVLMYVLSHQLVHRGHRWRVPKELCVAALLTGGVAVFTATADNLGHLAAPLMAFGVLCFTNCALISTWELDVDTTHDDMSFTRQFRLGGSVSRWLPWGLAATVAMTLVRDQGPARAAALCAVESALLLGGVDLLERRVGRQMARVLADVALMTPLLFWLVS